jgi:type IV pilus biogenesis protein CpaD/CtpE
MAEVGTHEHIKGKGLSAVSVTGGGGTQTFDLPVSGFVSLVLLARMTASASGDLAVAVQAYEDDGTTAFAVSLPTDQAVASALNAGVARLLASYKLNGIDKVKVTVTNTNVAAQTVTVVYYATD